MHKAALAYKGNDCAFYLDGTLIGVDTSCTIPTVSELYLRNVNIKNKSVALWKERLTNDQLAQLTTL